MRYIVNQNAIIFSIDKQEKIDRSEIMSNGECFIYVDKEKAKKKRLSILGFEEDFVNDEIVLIEIDKESETANFIIEGNIVKSCALYILEAEIAVFSDI